MDAIECIMNRYSIRRYSDKPVDDQIVRRIIEAGIAAPSGKNGQPWKFKIITEKTLIEQISNISLYGAWMKSASLFVLCFLDSDCSYDYIKDIQSCGAAMQNMLLAAHASGIGGCWVGEILAKAETVKQVLSLAYNNTVIDNSVYNGNDVYGETAETDNDGYLYPNCWYFEMPSTSVVITAVFYLIGDVDFDGDVDDTDAYLTMLYHNRQTVFNEEQLISADVDGDGDVDDVDALYIAAYYEGHITAFPIEI